MLTGGDEKSPRKERSQGIQPSLVHVQHGKPPADKRPSHRHPQQKAPAKHNLMYWKPPRECERDFREEELLLLQTLCSASLALELLMIYVWLPSTQICANWSNKEKVKGRASFPQKTF